ncbi:MAG: hypothetical protein WCK65_13100, partial [Rhodospirillaceae bacterium]
MMELYDLLPPTSMISIADIGAMLLDSNRPFYHGLVEVGRARVFAFEPDKTECDKLNLVMGNGYRIFPNFVGDGGPATYYQTN